MTGYRPLGRTGIDVHPLCLGGNVFGGNADREASFEVLDAYVELGGNYVDTAEVYSRWIPGNQGGESEAMIGEWLRERSSSAGERPVIATKLAPPLSAARLRDECEASLRRLGVEAVEVYYAHSFDTDTPLEETLEALDGLVRAGRVRHLGASNFTAEQLQRSLDLQRDRGWAEFEVVQPGYSLLNRGAYEGPLQALCVREGLGVSGYAALGAGFLTGKYRRDAPPPATPRADAVARRYQDEHGWRVLDAVLEVAAESGATPAQVALAWVMAQPGLTGPIAAAMSRAQVEELVAAAEVRLDAAAMARLDAASAPRR